MSAGLLAAVLALGSVSGFAQTNLPAAPAPAAEDKQKAAQEKHAAPILAALKLGDAAKEAKVRKALSAFFPALAAWHQANDDRLKTLWSDFNQARSKQDKAAADQALADIDGVYATFQPQHDQLISGLGAELSPEQIETVEDVITVNKVKVTYDVYLQIFPKLTDEQKAVVLKNLKAAREEAVNASSMTEKSAFFKKYKIKIEEDYLTSQGYDPKQARKDFAAKQKADAAKKNDATGKAE